MNVLRSQGILCLLVVLLKAFPGLALGNIADLQFYGFEKEGLSSEAQQGLDHIFGGNVYRSAFPLSIFLDVKKQLISSPDGLIDIGSPQGQFTVYGNLPSPRRRVGDLPLVSVSIGNSIFRRNGSLYLNTNCFTCHAGVANGTVIAGLGNSHLDQLSLLQDVRSIVEYARSDRKRKSESEERELNYFLEYARTTLLPTFKHARARGDNVGPYGVWKTMSRFISPSQTGLLTLPSFRQTPLSEWFDEQFLPTIDPNPWWHLKYKNTTYRYGDASPYDASHFALNFTQPHALVNEMREWHVDVISKALAFARETQSPLFPHELNRELVKEGEDLYHGTKRTSGGKKLRCARCHGSYVKRDAFPSYREPGGWLVSFEDGHLRDVGTDLTYSNLLMSFGPLIERLKQLESFFTSRGQADLAPQGSIPDRRGYLPPPLDGVWASAPYFHNGSVPTLSAVLDSRSRPEIWARDAEDSHQYDLRHVGLSFVPISTYEYAQYERRAKSRNEKSLTRIQLKAIYNTLHPGKLATGHRYGDRLTHHERWAVIEFLKSLSGPDMLPGES